MLYTYLDAAAAVHRVSGFAVAPHTPQTVELMTCPWPSTARQMAVFTAMEAALSEGRVACHLRSVLTTLRFSTPLAPKGALGPFLCSSP
jgi:hypothetical protein